MHKTTQTISHESSPDELRRYLRYLNRKRASAVTVGERNEIDAEIWNVTRWQKLAEERAGQ